MNRTIRNGARRLPQWTTRNKSSLRPAAQSWAALTPLNSVHAVSAPLDSRQRPSNTTLFGNNSGMDNTHSSPSNRNSIASSSGGTSEVRRRSSSGALSFLAQKSSPRRQFTNLEERDSYYTSAIAACGRNWRRAVLLMNEFEREASSGQYSGKPLPASVYGATMHVCAQGGEWALTLELLDSMGKVPPSSSSDGASLMSRPLPNVRCYEEALLACSLSRQANAALALIETMRTGTHHRQSGAVSLNDPTAGAVTDSAGAAKSSDGGAAAAAAADVAFKPSDRCLNLAMTACTRAGQSNDALKLFDTFQSQRLVEPNEFIYGAAAAACRAGGHWQRAIKLLDQMEASVVAGQDSSGVAAVAPNEVIYTAVIAACGAAKQWVAALEVFERMQRVGKLKPNVVTYASVISACGEAGQWQRALQVLHLMQVEPNAWCFNAAITACAKAEQWQYSLKLLDVMERRGVQPNIYCFNSAISACERAGQWESAVALLDSMAEMGLAPNAVTFTVAISACGKGGQPETAMSLLAAMEARGLPKSVHAYTAAVSALERSGDAAGALALMDEMEKKGVAPNAHTFATAITACGARSLHRAGATPARWPEALQMLTLMESRGLKPDVHCLCAAIAVCTKAGAWDEAMKLLGSLESRGIRPSEELYGTTLEACVSARKHDEALEVMIAGRERGLYESIWKAPSQAISLEHQRIAVSKAVLWCLLDEWSSGEREAKDDVTLMTGPRVFLELKDLLPHDLPWKEVRKKLNAAASKEKAAIMMTGDVAGRSAHTQEEDFKAPPRGENGGVDSDATSKSAGEEVTRSSEEGSPVGISITAADILQWQSKGGWWSFRGNQKEEVVA